MDRAGAPSARCTAAELARQRLPGLPTTERRVRELLKRRGARGSKRPGREGGGGREYCLDELLAVLPARAAAALRRRYAADALPVPRREPQEPARLKAWQRGDADARTAVCQEVERLIANGETATAAIESLVSATGFAESTIRRWLSDWRRDGWSALVSAGCERASAQPAWMADFWCLYGRPGKPSIAMCHEKLSAERDDLPSLRQVQRLVRQLGAIERNRGRMDPSELKAIKPYVRRDTAGMEPGEVFLSDGHTADLEVANPDTGRPFRPEIISVIDVATRVCVGWSTGVAESSLLAADALRHAAGVCIPALFYTDRGGGFVNQHLGDEAYGVLARLGTTLTTALPYNSQARGIVERFHQSTWVRGARSLPGFVGKDMGPEARKRFFKRTRRDIERFGQSRVLMSWADFTAWCESEVAAYNSRPHSALPKIVDPETGKRRHQTPAEAWAEHVAAGWEPVSADQATLDDLFRPQTVRTVNRGQLRLWDGWYFAAELEELDGERVFVGYDVHGKSRVWVRDVEQRLVAIAELDGNKADYFPRSAIERAREQRTAAQLVRLERKAERLTPVAETIEGAGWHSSTPALVAVGERKPPAANLRRPSPQNVQERRRRKAAPGEAHQKIWTALRSRVEPWSTRDLTAAAGCVKRSVTLYLQALASAGYVEVAAPAGSGGMGAAFHRLVQDTGPRAPMRLRDGTVYDPNRCEIVEPPAGERAKLRVVAGGR